MNFFDKIFTSIFGKKKNQSSDTSTTPITDNTSSSEVVSEKKQNNDTISDYSRDYFKTERAWRRKELEEELVLLEKKLEFIQENILTIKEEKKNISKQTHSDLRIKIEIKENSDTFLVFQPPVWNSIPSMAEYKAQRIEEECKRIDKAEKIATETIKSIRKSIKRRNLAEAIEGLNIISQLTVFVENQNIRDQIKEVVLSITDLDNQLKAEKLAKKDQQRKKEALKAKQRAETLEYERQTKEARQLRDEEERRERDRKYRQELLKKNEAEKKERRFLASLYEERKSDADEIVFFLRENAIHFFYHFTDESNVALIRSRKGLYSWSYLLSHNLTIPCPGGDNTSRGIDRDKGLEDYVRLSLCKSHPMAHRLYVASGGRTRLVLLKIKIDVAMLKNTKFSNINATDKKAKIGDDKDFIENNFDFDAIGLNGCSSTDLRHKKRQAEVMVKTFIPAKYIINLDCPEIMAFNK